VAEATASLLKMVSGWFSDRIGNRKWLAVIGYSISALSKPFFYLASSWGLIAGVRWADRVGKGVRTAPRDALVADSTPLAQRGRAFGFHRAMDHAGAVLGILISAAVVWAAQRTSVDISRNTFQTLVLLSLIPAFLAVLTLATGARETVVEGRRQAPRIQLKQMGKPFLTFLVIVSLFTLGNSSDAFLVLRAQNLGVSVLGILIILAAFNLVVTLLSTHSGGLSDRIGRKRVIIGGWLIYAVIYLGFGLADQAWHAWALYALYGVYYSLAFGTANALVADLVPAELRGTAYGTYHAVVGLLAFPSSLIAGILWQGLGGWSGFGPSAPFLFGGGLALLATILLAVFMPSLKYTQQQN
jgi:MFS family permease